MTTELLVETNTGVQPETPLELPQPHLIRANLSEVCPDDARFNESVVDPLTTKLVHHGKVCAAVNVAGLLDQHLRMYNRRVGNGKDYQVLHEKLSSLMVAAVVFEAEGQEQVSKLWSEKVEQAAQAHSRRGEKRRTARVERHEARLQRRLGKLGTAKTVAVRKAEPASKVESTVKDADSDKDTSTATIVEKPLRGKKRIRAKRAKAKMIAKRAGSSSKTTAKSVFKRTAHSAPKANAAQSSRSRNNGKTDRGYKYRSQKSLVY